MVSVIVPVEPDGDPAPCLSALKRLDWPSARLEVLVAWGRQPSRQRNLAAKRAKGEWLLFLDSDSRPRPDLLKRLLGAAGRFRALAAGGPNLPLESEGALGMVFSAVLASYFGSMSARARYTPIGLERLSSEKELILCNLAVRRASFASLKGFREELYPNEENEFLNRLQDAGGRLVYVPDAVVERPRRRSVAAFCRQAFGYGRGRMQQMRVNFHSADLLNLLPLVALAYGLALPSVAWRFPWTLAAPAAYVAAALAACLEIAARRGAVQALATLPLFPLRHLAYGLGLVSGIFGPGYTKSGLARIRIKKWRH